MKLRLCMSAVPNLFGTRSRFRGRQFFHGQGGGGGSGGNASDGERQVMLCDPVRYPSAAWGLGTPALCLSAEGIHSKRQSDG